jgi:hypothetical protein
MALEITVIALRRALSIYRHIVVGIHRSTAM